MPYRVKKGTKCVYKKDTGKKVGCTKGSVNRYLAALHANVDENMSLMSVVKEIEIKPFNLEDIINSIIGEEYGFNHLENIIEMANDGDTYEMRDFIGDNRQNKYILYQELKKNPSRIKCIRMNENEEINIDISGYKTMIGITYYPESNRATGDIVLIK